MIQRIKVFFAIIVLSALFFLPVILSGKPRLVGDGSEYYALSLAWKTTVRPFMTSTSWEAYDHFFESHQIIRLSPATRFNKTPPALHLGNTTDFNHFWFYSLCATALGWLFSPFGVSIPIHASFLFLHYILFTIMLTVAWKKFGWEGVVTASVLTVVSPMIWYTNKVHTEFFTYCLTTSAIIFFLRKNYIETAFFLALASTQNVSFIPISLFAIGLDIFFRKRRKYSFRDVIFIISTVLLVLLHPMYYFFRFGVLTPQMLAGGADLFTNIPYIYIWWFDPDIGLFPNWPFGIALAIYALFLLYKGRLSKTNTYRYLAFVIVYAGINLLAQSSTINLNSGATPGVARYALWYLALFFPVLLLIVHESSLSFKTSFVTGAFVIFGILFSVKFFRPSLPTGQTTPSVASFLIQKYTPFLYNPPPQIFAGRYNGEQLSPRILLKESAAIIGPDCRKILLMNRATDNNYTVLGGVGCGLDAQKVNQLIRHRIEDNLWSVKEQSTYVSLSQSDVEKVRFIPTLDEWYVPNLGGVASAWLLSGWSSSESWGTWSRERKAKLAFPCSILKEQTTFPSAILFNVHSFSTVTKLSIKIDSNTVWTGVPEEQAFYIKTNIPDNICRQDKDDKMIVTFIIADIASPSSLDLSDDTRLLGVGLRGIKFISSTQ